MAIEIVKLTDKQMQQRYKFTQSKLEMEQLMRKTVLPSLVQSIVGSQESEEAL